MHLHSITTSALDNMRPANKGGIMIVLAMLLLLNEPRQIWQHIGFCMYRHAAKKDAGHENKY